jgi:hypothetical protein
MVVEAALPKAGREFTVKEIAGRLLPLGNKLHQVRASKLSLNKKVYMIGHEAIRVYQKPEGFGDVFQRLDGNFAAIRALENRETILAANGDEIDFAADVLVAG